jgi:low temperature requirement protein LtrA
MIKTKIWQPIRLRRDEETEAERRASWLELFFDLIFVAAIGELAHGLSEHLNWTGLVDFAVFFVPIWWCWIGATFYATRFDNDTVFDRLFTLIQMTIVAIMAVNVHHGLELAAVTFATCYCAFRGSIVCQYLLAGYHVPAARNLTRRYASGFGASVILWGISIFLPPPWRLLCWGLGLAIDLITPLTAGKLVAEVPPSVTHIPERVGLFTIIVLGEAIIAVVQGLSKYKWDVNAGITALLALSIAFSLWWLYFETANRSPIVTMREGKVKLAVSWLYLHLPLTMSLAAASVGIQRLIVAGNNPPQTIERWLCCGAMAASLACLTAIHWLTCSQGAPKFKTILTGYRLGSVALVLTIATFGHNLSGLTLVMLIAIACGIQVMLDAIQGIGFQNQ